MKEENKKNLALFEETGGIRFGESYWFSANYTFPFAKIRIFKEKIILTWGESSKIEFRKDEIQYLEKYKGILGGILGKGVRICHKKSRTWKFIIFWSFSVDNLLSKLKNAGYELK